MQFWNLWMRRSRTLWLKPRVSVSTLLVFVIIAVQVLLMKMNPEFVPYRLHAVYSYLLAQDTIQRYYHLKLNTYLSGTSIFIYHAANVLADSLLPICGTFLFYLFFSAYVANENESLKYDDLNIVFFTILGTIGIICLCHLLGLLINHPLLAPGLFHLPLSYFSFFIFNFTPFPLFILPNILSAYAILRQFKIKLELTHAALDSLQNWLFYVLLIFQIVFYFILVVFFDLLLHRHLRPRSTGLQRRQESYDPSPPILYANFKDRSLDKQFQFSLSPSSILCVYGPPESGKSSLIHLLSKLLTTPRTRYSGRCNVMGSNILSPSPPPFPLGSVGLCIERDLFDDNFTAYEQLWFMGKLRSVPSQTLYSQIFFITKLLQLDGHLYKKICHLSGGTRRKVSVACALLASPNLLLIDEPTRSLDPRVGKSLLLGLQFLVHHLQNSLLFTSKKVEQHLLIADQVLQMSSKSHPLPYHSSMPLSQVFSVKIIYSFIKKGSQWRTSFQVSPISGSHSYVATEPSHQIQEELYALSLSFKQLKEDLVLFLKELAEHQGTVRQILIV